uniref:Uncharacterized protein n=1 Tax=Rhizophora mucronata TaxID=61149 RepID=A0A2P2P7J3_RHIMU
MLLNQMEFNNLLVGPNIYDELL